ncbi:hypothetical protein [Phaeodactylibacter xiamenensis]|uniref:hypothetical protein n=1 Tax=Phaeodactylibacter xiamenensis TaxID=1524460 RepID=UPI003BAC1D71
MDYKLVHQEIIEGKPKEVDFFDSILAFPSSDQLIKFYSLKNLETPKGSFLSNDKYSSCFFVENFLVVRENHSIALMKPDGTVSRVKRKLAASHLHCGRMIFVKVKDDATISLGAILCDNPEVILWKTNTRIGQFRICKGETLFATGYLKKNLVFCVDVNTGELIWQINLKQTLSNTGISYSECSGICGVYRKKLVLSTKGIDGIICLDPLNGEIIETWHELPTGTTLGPQQSRVLPNPAHSVLHEEAGKILGLTGYYYWEIDLQTGALQAQDCTSGFKSRRLRAMTPPVCQGDHLYFSSDEVFEKPDGTLGHDIKLAAFNWRTRQIDWEWAFDHPGEGLYQIGMPKVHGDYLAAADTGGQLHLFKKTS